MDAGQSFHLVHVYDDTITHAVVPVVDAPTGDYFSPEWVERMAALSPEERLEQFSRKRLRHAPTRDAAAESAAVRPGGRRHRGRLGASRHRLRPTRTHTWHWTQ